jgi:hypothetical protein
MNKYKHIVTNLPKIVGSSAGEQKVSSDEEVRQLEEAIGFELPDDYRDFLKFNGDISVSSGVDLSHRSGYPTYAGCEYFFGIDPEEQTNSIYREYKNMSRELPPKFFPISSSDNGSVCIVLDGPERGHIYFLHCGQGVKDILEERLYLISNSFDEFMRLLG